MQVHLQKKIEINCDVDYFFPIVDILFGFSKYRVGVGVGCSNNRYVGVDVD